jgi:hypothetical protein
MYRLWIRFVDALPVIWICRFAVLSVVLGGVLLIFVDQAQEAIVRVVEASRPRRFVELAFALAAVSAWALSAWYCSRVLLRFKFPQSPHATEELVKWAKRLPHWLGVSVFVIAGVAVIRAGVDARLGASGEGWRLYALGLTCLAGAVIFWLFVERRPFKLDAAKLAARGFAATNPYLAVFPIGDGLPRDLKIWIGVWLASGLLLFLAFTFFPYGFGGGIGAVTIFILAFGAWIPFGSTLVYLSERWHRLPLLAILVLVAVAWGLCPWLDNHDVRLLPAPAPARPELKDFLRDWLHERRDEIAASTQYPVFVVAASGGGIRAAYWTASVLGEAQDRCPAFARHTLALSGVSGGSLGVATFAALVAQNPSAALAPSSPCIAGPIPQNGVRTRAARILEEDFLAPTVATMLYPDLVYRFLPLAFLPQHLTDRGVTLEQGWERAWFSHENNDRFAQAFGALRAGEAARVVPALFLNSTTVETGDRIIVSNVDVSAPPFSSSYDALKIAGHEMPLSTAVHLSARFTYVSPAGSLRTGADRKLWGHVVDGGYFENSGHTATFEIMDTLARCLTRAENCFSSDRELFDSRLRVVLITITNEPQDAERARSMPAPRPAAFMNEVLSPLRAMLNARAAHGVFSETAAEHLARNEVGMVIELRVVDQGVMLPLGWTLARGATENLDKQIRDNARKFERIGALLR